MGEINKPNQEFSKKEQKVQSELRNRRKKMFDDITKNNRDVWGVPFFAADFFRLLPKDKTPRVENLIKMLDESVEDGLCQKNNDGQYIIKPLKTQKVYVLK